MPLLGSAVARSDQRVSLRRSSREIEQGGEHLRGQLDRDPLHPVEGLVARQVVEDGGGALADQHGELVEMRRREHRLHGLALRTVLRLVHGDEARPVVVLADVAERDAAEPYVGGEDRRVGVDMHDVAILGHRPVAAHRAGGAEVHRLLVAQPLEIGPQRIGTEQLGMAGMKFRERRRVGLFAGGAQPFVAGGSDRPVHWSSPLISWSGWLPAPGYSEWKLQRLAAVGASGCGLISQIAIGCGFHL